MSYHAHRFDERSVIVSKAGKPAAVFPCTADGDSVVSHGGLTYAGLIYGIELRAVDVISIFEALICYYRSQGFERIIYKAVPHIFHRYPAEEDLYALYRFGAVLVGRDLSSVIPISNRPKLSDSRKNTVRKAERAGLTIEHDIDLKAFHSLLTKTLRDRHGASPVHDVDELGLLMARFPGYIRAFGARGASGDYLAAALIYDFGHVVHSQYLASSDEGRNVGALDFLLAQLLDSTFEQRQFFSFGISTQYRGRVLNEGLVFQKEGFGGRAVMHDFYELRL